MLNGEFTLDCKIEFSEVKKKPLDMTRLQAGMFMDRPDLWKSPSLKRQKPVAVEQQSFF